MCARPALALSLALLLGLAGPARAQRAPAPDPSALAAATELRRTGATAEVVAREVMSTYRQSGPQMVQILAKVRYPDTDIGRAVAAQTRSSTTTAASWLVQAAMPGSAAYAALFVLNRSSAATVGAMIGAGYPARDAVASRQSIHPADLATHAMAATEVAVALRDGYGATNVAIGNALAEAGYSALQAVIAFKDGIGLTLKEMTALATQLTYNLHEMQSAIMQNFDG